MQHDGTVARGCYPSPDRLSLRLLGAAAVGSETSWPQKHEVSGRSIDQRGGTGDGVAGGASGSEFPEASRMRSVLLFYLCYLLCVALGLACVFCVFLWNSRWQGGFAWDLTAQEFNWHPVLMVTGLVVTYGYGAVLYRIPLTWGQNKLPWKLLHAAMMLLSLILAVVGLCAVFDVHNAHKAANLYSLHSWTGIFTVALFAMQWLLGFAGFLLPCSPVALRKLLKPAHVWLGGSILLLSVAACVSGINEKLFFALKAAENGSQPYSSLPAEAVLANSLGALIVAFGLVVLMILSNSKWQRADPRPEDLAYTPLLQEENGES